VSPLLPFRLLLLILFGIFAARGEEKKPPSLSDYYSILADGGGSPPSGDQYDAFSALLQAKEPGWGLLSDLLLNVDREGDAARRIWSGPLQDTPETGPFAESFEKELDRRLKNETWALLYAKADLASLRYGRHITEYELIQNDFDSVREEAKRGTFGIDILYLRIRLMEYPSFPGHRFPWNGSAREKKQGIREILAWWNSHKKEVRAPDAEELDAREREAAKPSEATIVGVRPSGGRSPWPAGNVEVVTHGGVREKWTSAGNCLLPHVCPVTGAVGWLLFSKRDARGEPLPSTLRVLSPEFGRRDFHNSAAIELWAFSEDGASVVLKVRSAATGLSLVQYDLRTRKPLGQVQGTVPYAQLPPWARVLAEDTASP
jgi:hypothetical protein